MPKYWGKQILSLGSLHNVGQKQKTEGKKGGKSETFSLNNKGQLRNANAT